MNNPNVTPKMQLSLHLPVEVSVKDRRNKPLVIQNKTVNIWPNIMFPTWNSYTNALRSPAAKLYTFLFASKADVQPVWTLCNTSRNQTGSGRNYATILIDRHLRSVTTAKHFASSLRRQWVRQLEPAGTLIRFSELLGPVEPCESE